MAERDEVDGLLDKYGAAQERLRNEEQQADTRQHEFAEEFNAWAHRIAMPYLEELAERLSCRGVEAKTMLTTTNGPTGPEVVLFSVHPEDPGRFASLAIRCPSNRRMATVERRGNYGGPSRSEHPLSELDEEWMRSTATNVVAYALSGAEWS